jgi:multidrug efflux system membrane fusion protein
MCVPLTSCTRVAAKANPAATEAIPVRAVLAVLEDVPLEIAAVGNVEAMDRVEVKSRVAGQINRVAFVEGQAVTKGQLLFSIDREALERQVLPVRLLRATPPQKGRASRRPMLPGNSGRSA